MSSTDINLHVNIGGKQYLVVGSARTGFNVSVRTMRGAYRATSSQRLHDAAIALAQAEAATAHAPVLTALEQRAMAAAHKSNDGNGCSFGFVEDIVKAMSDLKPQAVGGVVSSLQRKGLIYVYEPVTTDSGTWTQFTIKA